jgi:phosphatidylcholine synthase
MEIAGGIDDHSGAVCALDTPAILPQLQHALRTTSRRVRSERRMLRLGCSAATIQPAGTEAGAVSLRISMVEPTAATRAPPHKLWAWLVHLFTATGVVWSLLALLAVIGERWTEALLWLLLALIVDGVDGTLARAAHVKEQAPRIDGDVLDLVIDFLGYVFVPTVFMWRAGMLPEPFFVPLAALILISSLYVFARRDMKTPDGYFRGFPALWNVVTLYLFVTGLGPNTAAAVVVVLVILSFAPVLVVHPFRVRDFGPWLLVITGLWTASTAALLIPDLDAAIRSSLLAVSAVTSLLLLGLGLWRTVRGPAADVQPHRK